jgi:amino acid transporter
MGTAIFSSDPISSNAYATEAIMTTLATVAALGANAIGLTLPITIGIGILIGLVVLAYTQTIKHYPLGGGGFIVALDNLGNIPALVTASALMFDYILTVAVSVAAGVKAVLSIPWAQANIPAEIHLGVTLETKVIFGVIIIGLIALANLRGLRESGRIFMIPTYLFVFTGWIILGWGFFRMTGLFGAPPLVPIAKTMPVSLPGFSPWMVIWLIMRAFASGCTALTGIEAISDGVAAFKSWKHALNAMKFMAFMALSLFIPISFFAVKLGAFPNDSESVLSQVGQAIVGNGGIYLVMQGATMLILTLAANTAFQDFPRLCNFLARDGFLPRWYMNIGRRLSFDYGILTLMLLSGTVFVFFRGEEQHMLPLYAIGVFITFTISQSSMAKMWTKISKIAAGQSLKTIKTELHYEKNWRIYRRMNISGAILTFIVLCVLIATKWHDGGYAIFIAIAVIVSICLVVKLHYNGVAKRLSLADTGSTTISTPGATDHPDRYILVPVGDVHKATIRTLADAAGKGNVLGVYIEIDPSQTSRVKERWAQYVGTNIPLIVVQEEYRDVSGAMIRYIMEFKGGLVGNQNVSVHITRLTTWNPFWLFLWRFLHNNGTKELEYDLRQNGITYTTLPYRV